MARAFTGKHAYVSAKRQDALDPALLVEKEERDSEDGAEQDAQREREKKEAHIFLFWREMSCSRFPNSLSIIVHRSITAFIMHSFGLVVNSVELLIDSPGISRA